MNMETVVAGMPPKPVAPRTKQTLKKAAAKGRNGDTVLAHLTPDEIVVPVPMQTPKVMAALESEFERVNVPLDRYRVGGEGQSINPETGHPEYFFKKIFSGIKKIAGPALSIAGMATGNPLLAAAGSAIGAGISGGNPLIAGIQGGLGSYFGGMGGIGGTGGTFLQGLGAGSNAISGASNALPWLSGTGFNLGYGLGNTMIGRGLSPILGGLQFSSSLGTSGLGQLLSSGQQQAPAIQVSQPNYDTGSSLGGSSGGGFSVGGDDVASGAVTPPASSFDARTAGAGIGQPSRSSGAAYADSAGMGGSPQPTAGARLSPLPEATTAGIGAPAPRTSYTGVRNRDVNYGTPARARAGAPVRNSAASAPRPTPASPTTNLFEPQDTPEFSYMRRNPSTGLQQFAAVPEMYSQMTAGQRPTPSPAQAPVKKVLVRGGGVAPVSPPAPRAPRPEGMPLQPKIFVKSGTKPMRGRDMMVYTPSSGGSFEGAMAGQGMPTRAIRRV
jgi:hypothetical protein